MKRKFYTCYVVDGHSGEKLFNNATVLLEVSESDENKIPLLLQEKLSKKINDRSIERFIPVTLINFWEIDLL